jgi:hypothetical protein
MPRASTTDLFGRWRWLMEVPRPQGVARQGDITSNIQLDASVVTETNVVRVVSGLSARYLVGLDLALAPSGQQSCEPLDPNERLGQRCAAVA